MPKKHYSEKNQGCSPILWVGAALFGVFLLAVFCGYEPFRDSWGNW